MHGPVLVKPAVDNMVGQKIIIISIMIVFIMTEESSAGN